MQHTFRHGLVRLVASAPQTLRHSWHYGVADTGAPIAVPTVALLTSNGLLLRIIAGHGILEDYEIPGELLADFNTL